MSADICGERMTDSYRSDSSICRIGCLFILCLLCFATISISQDPETETAWVCPMHGDYTMDVAGKCPRCGMDLVRAAPFDVRDYRLDLRTEPSVVKVGQNTKLLFRIFHP